MFVTKVNEDDFSERKDIPVIFILCWNRPIYLWVCLDSIYRHTQHDCKIIIADNHSSYSQTRDVIKAFDRRGMFYQVDFCKENDPLRLKKIIDQYSEEIGAYFVIIEGDIEILPTKRMCWLSHFVSYMNENSNMASIGSRVYKKDFVDIKNAKALMPDLADKELAFLIKENSPERHYKHKENKDVALIEPHNAPLRLMIFRDEFFRKIEFGRDFQIYKRFKNLGYDAKISTEVVHRHLSLLNIYDYCDYSGSERNAFFEKQL